MNKSAVIHARIEPRIKRKAETVLKTLGLSPTEAIRLLYRQICLHSGLPFSVRIPNALTRETLARSSRGEKSSILTLWIRWLQVGRNESLSQTTQFVEIKRMRKRGRIGETGQVVRKLANESLDPNIGIIR